MVEGNVVLLLCSIQNLKSGFGAGHLMFPNYLGQIGKQSKVWDAAHVTGEKRKQNPPNPKNFWTRSSAVPARGVLLHCLHNWLEPLD